MRKLVTMEGTDIQNPILCSPARHGNGLTLIADKYSSDQRGSKRAAKAVPAIK
jgi:hypothetical protein